MVHVGPLDKQLDFALGDGRAAGELLGELGPVQLCVDGPAHDRDEVLHAALNRLAQLVLPLARMCREKVVEALLVFELHYERTSHANALSLHLLLCRELLHGRDAHERLQKVLKRKALNLLARLLRVLVRDAHAAPHERERRLARGEVYIEQVDGSQHLHPL
eukprot:2708544-Prymnesium_polylepis.2